MRRPSLWRGVVIVLFAVVSLAAREQTTRPAPQAADAVDGSKLYAQYCATCHGRSGQGNGPMAGLLRTPPPDLTQIAARADGKFPSYTVARIIDGRQPLAGHGGPDMPIWADAFTRSTDASDAAVKARIDALVRFIESLQPKRGD